MVGPMKPLWLVVLLALLSWAAAISRVAPPVAANLARVQAEQEALSPSQLAQNLADVEDINPATGRKYAWNNAKHRKRGVPSMFLNRVKFADLTAGGAQKPTTFVAAGAMAKTSASTSTSSTSSGATYITVSSTTEATEWWIYVLLILGALLILFFCFLLRKAIPPCVASIEIGLYWLIKSILFPFQVLLYLFKKCFYPIKQCTIVVYRGCDAYYHPSRVKI